MTILCCYFGNGQEGRPGLDEAARYIKRQLEIMKERAGPGYRYVGLVLYGHRSV